ncbi:ComF family protein [Jeotgalibacillus sp. R-1-5s-1]|uniref:ComF family protein n=1 Tax=Jeotgalibacillus sp. R-1-5s-1 TaxID=2555897 RepID=UPI00106C28CC|nr:ComF family protein [Jeotgalibacillus sp. R-1-5s-1]TFD95783.1 ComF family protein [Jeotgalibacillus sp. R-1-5s-1]
MRCLVCHERLAVDIGWSDLFSPPDPDPFCERCRRKLVRIDDDHKCSLCSRKMDVLTDACEDCERWARHPVYGKVLDKNFAIYEYNDELKELIKTLKYSGDYALAGCFQKEMRQTVKKLKGIDLIVPVPLSEQKLKERGFNQTEAFLAEAGILFQPFLQRMNDQGRSQAKKNKRDRHTGQNPFKTDEHVRGQSILIVDDLYTTGTTIRHAAWTLKRAGADRIYSLTIGR